MAKLILIIDDSSLVRAHMRTFLQEEGYQVEEAENGQIGLDKALKLSPDLLICDVSMPVMNGLEMLGALHEKNVKIPAFVLTTEAQPQMIAEGRKVGTTAWMVKPFNPKALRAGLKKVLGGP